MVRIATALVTALLAGSTAPLVAQAQFARVGFTPRADAQVAFEPVTAAGYAYAPTPTGVPQYLWRHDDGEWLAVTTAHVPPPTYGPLATWPGHGILLFANGLWLFDGSDWTSLPTSSGPNGLVAMAFDETRQRLVGITAATGGAVWEFDGTNWQSAGTGPSPLFPPFEPVAMAWLAATQEVVVVMPGSLLQLYGWNGATWTPRFAGFAHPGTSVAPAPGGGLLLAGGFLFPLTWDAPRVWNGTAMVTLPVPGRPDERPSPDLWFDPVRQRTVVTGVRPGNGNTWDWDGTAWHRAAHGARPPFSSTEPFVPGIDHTSTPPAYDSWRGELVQFGGSPWYGAVHDQFWRWRDGTWTQASAGAPTARTACATAFDSWRGRFIVFGGAFVDAPGGGVYMVDQGGTHEWDGQTWHSQTYVPAAAWDLQIHPCGRYDAAMAFDAQRGRTVLFGGTIGTQQVSTGVPSGTRNDTYEWDGVAWQRMAPMTVPPQSPDPSMVFDPARGQCVLASGSTLWTWDGSDWAPIPSTSVHGRLAIDPTRGVLLRLRGDAQYELQGATWVQVGSDHCKGNQTFDPSLGAIVGFDDFGTYTFGVPGAATIQPFGAACAGSQGAPVLHGERAPQIGRSLAVALANMPPSNTFFGMLGSDADQWLGSSLPIDLSPLGMTGCELVTEIAAFELRTGTTWTIAVPGTAALLGATFRLQAFVFDALANPLGATTSNGLRIRVGA